MQKKGIEKKLSTRRKNKVYKIKQIDIDKLESEVSHFMQTSKSMSLLPSWSMFCRQLANIIEIEFPDQKQKLQSLLLSETVANDQCGT